MMLTGRALAVVWQVFCPATALSRAGPEGLEQREATSGLDLVERRLLLAPVTLAQLAPPD